MKSMNAQETNAIFRYLLDTITQNQGMIPQRALPVELKADVEFAIWMNNLDYSQDSLIQTSLRNALQKNAELVSNASRIRTVENPTRLEVKKPLPLPIWISIIAGSVSILTATLLVVFSKTKKKISDEQTIQP